MPHYTEDTFTLTNPSETCHGNPHPLAIEGIILFNSGMYFDSHEVLEEIWRQEGSPIRELYRGILQVAVGYYHIQRGNHRGALKMFTRCRKWLAPFSDHCRGVNLSKLRQDFGNVEEILRQLHPGQSYPFDTHPFQPIDFEPYSKE